MEWQYHFQNSKWYISTLEVLVIYFEYIDEYLSWLQCVLQYLTKGLKPIYIRAKQSETPT